MASTIDDRPHTLQRDSQPPACPFKSKWTNFYGASRALNFVA